MRLPRWLGSLVNVMHKELIQTLRDRRMVASLLVAPVLQLVIFGYAVDLQVRHIPTVVCDQDQSRASRSLVQSFLAGRTFDDAGRVDTPGEAQARLVSGRAAVALLVPPGFAARLVRRDHPEAQLLIDGTDSVEAEVAAAAGAAILALHGIGTPPAAGPPPERATLRARILYNQRLATPVYMLPGILGTLLMNVTAIITAMGLARERETGTLEQLLVTPIRPTTLVLGKCLPYVLFGLVDVAAVLFLGSLIFHMPLRGPLSVVAVGSFLYVFSTLGIGIFIATMSASQQQAMLGAFAFILPAMLLSGFFTPISSMPAWLRPVTLLLPMRHFIEIMRACLIRGSGFADLLRPIGWLAALGVTIFGASMVSFRRRLG